MYNSHPPSFKPFPARPASNSTHRTFPPTTTMASAEVPAEDTHHKVPTHPIAPRLKNGHKTPHVGPHIHAYKYRALLPADSSELTVVQVPSFPDGRSRERCLVGEGTCLIIHLRSRAHAPIILDREADPPLGSSLPNRPRRGLRDGRHRLVPRGRPERVVQLRRPLGV